MRRTYQREQAVSWCELHADLRMTLDSIGAMIWYEDTEHKVLWVNRAAAEAIGLAAEKLEGRSTEEVFPGGGADRPHQVDLQVSESGKPKHGVEHYRTASGETRWIAVDRTPDFDAEGRAQGVIVFALDITELVRAQRELEKQSEDLSKMVNLMAGREVRMADLKDIIAKLRAQLEKAGLKSFGDDP